MKQTKHLTRVAFLLVSGLSFLSGCSASSVPRYKSEGKPAINTQSVQPAQGNTGGGEVIARNPSIEQQSPRSLKTATLDDRSAAGDIELVTQKQKEAAAYVKRGIANSTKGRFDSSIADFKKAIEINPEDPKARAFLASDYAKRGMEYSLKHNYKMAIADYTCAIEFHPNDQYQFLNFHNRAGAKHKIGDIDGAIDDYSKGIAIADSLQASGLYIRRGDLKKEKGDNSGAHEDYKRATELNQGSAFAYRFTGLEKMEKGDLQGAIIDFTKSIEQCGTFEAYVDRGIAKTKLGYKKDGLKDMDIGLQIKQGLIYSDSLRRIDGIP